MSAERIEALLAEAVRWRDEDPDPVTRAQVDEMLLRRDRSELEEHFGRRLGFGTAGIRGPLGVGPNRMNRLVARRVGRGVATQLATSVTDAAARGVVVGRDARHGSEEMAAELVEVLTGFGIAVHLFDEPVPTPLAVFAVSHLGAAGGLVVTASHNPPSDNGIKVVWADGAQIVAPIDAAISHAMEQSAPEQRPTAPGAVVHRGPVHRLGGAAGDHPVVQAYLDRARSLGTRPERSLRVATTALHGVGAILLERVLREAGHTQLHPVRSQERPDPDFPTVSMPNPEEPGALVELLATASEAGAAVALAVDPDADRLAVAVSGPPLTPVGWRVLTGDETGALLLWHLLARTEGRPDRFAASTVVSSRLARRMCEAAGVRHVETLTGFKWLCRPGLEHPHWHQVLLYEEALGYAVGDGARDKDGITAAVVLLDLAAELAASGRSILDVLDDLAVTHGLHVSLNGSVASAGASGTAVQFLATSPPEEVAGRRVRSWDRPAPDVARLVLDDDTRIVVRPSGTEPKVKYYLEAVVSVTDRTAVDDARAQALRRLVAVRDALGSHLGV